MTYTFLDIALDILKTAEKPLKYQEIWEMGVEATRLPTNHNLL